MTTIDGARALNMEAEIGTLEAGKRADIIIVSTKTPEMHPTLPFVSNLVYAASDASVLTTIINDAVVMEDSVVKTIDEEKFLTGTWRGVILLAVTR